MRTESSSEIGTYDIAQDFKKNVKIKLGSWIVPLNLDKSSQYLSVDKERLSTDRERFCQGSICI